MGKAKDWSAEPSRMIFSAQKSPELFFFSLLNESRCKTSDKLRTYCRRTLQIPTCRVSCFFFFRTTHGTRKANSAHKRDVSLQLLFLSSVSFSFLALLLYCCSDLLMMGYRETYINECFGVSRQQDGSAGGRATAERIYVHRSRLDEKQRGRNEKESQATSCSGQLAT